MPFWFLKSAQSRQYLHTLPAVPQVVNSECFKDNLTDSSFICDHLPHSGFYFYRKYADFTMWFLLDLICAENIGGLAP